jgi:cytochrome c oxidase cbb3-type subunit III
MTPRVILLAAWILASLLATTACGTRVSAPGRPSADSQPIPPSKIMDFSFLYSKNCAGCHGPDGKGGAAIGLGDPVYLAIADDATIRRVTAEGVPGTTMPAFAQHSGGMLTDEQINVIIAGIRTRWSKPHALRGADPPPYRAPRPGDPKRGASVYGTYCSSCHGADGRGGRASSIVDGSYLGLVSDQNLRTNVIVGRPEMGAPDWRNDVPGKPMSPEDVSDVVAWIAAQRPQFPGQPYASALQPEGGIR